MQRYKTRAHTAKTRRTHIHRKHAKEEIREEKHKEKKHTNIELENNLAAVGPPTVGRPPTVATRYVTQT